VLYNADVVSVDRAGTGITFQNPDENARQQGYFLGLVVVFSAFALFFPQVPRARRRALAKLQTPGSATIEDRAASLGSSASPDRATRIRARYSFWGGDVELAKTLPLMRAEKELWSGRVQRHRAARNLSYLRVTDTHVAVLDHRPIGSDGITYIPRGALIAAAEQDGWVRLSFRAEADSELLVQPAGRPIRELLVAIQHDIEA
jgi:hypothetical protein